MTKQTASDSAEQREAEQLMVAELSRELGVSLTTREVVLPDGHSPQIDGVSDSPFILCEAWAHQGRPRGAQPKKVMTDAMKMLYIEHVLERPAQKILLFSDGDAAAPFQAEGWHAHALREFDIEVRVVTLPKQIRDRVASAQTRQYR